MASLDKPVPEEYVSFPREFKKSLFQSLDKRFFTILTLSFLINVSLVIYFSSQPIPESESETVIKIQEQFVNLILEKESEEIEIKETPSPEGVIAGAEGIAPSGAGTEGGGGSEKKARSFGERMAEWKSRVRSRRRSRVEISKEVGSKGLLGVLGSTSSLADGEEVMDILATEGGTGEDLDQVLSGLDALQKSGVSTRGKGEGGGRRTRRGERASGGGTIDDLVAGLEEVKVTSLSRKGKLKVVSSRGLKAVGRKGAGRDAEAVLAVINSHMAAIQYCYQREWRKNPNLKGKIVVRFTIRPDGSVANAQIISSTLNNPAVENCILRVIRRWRDFGAIDPSKGDAVFRQEYIFGY